MNHEMDETSWVEGFKTAVSIVGISALMHGNSTLALAMAKLDGKAEEMFNKQNLEG